MSKFTFDESTHAYKLDGKRLTGVTTIIGVISKPSLISWSANKAVDYIKGKIRNIFKTNKEIIIEDLEPIYEEARIAHRKIKEQAGDIGTLVHSHIEYYVKAQIGGYRYDVDFETEQVEKMFNKFKEWAEEEKIKFLLSEQRVYSKKHFYAGTVDLVFEKGGKKYLGDIKTSSGIYNEAYIQMGGYHICLEELGKIKDVAGYCVINIPKQMSQSGNAKRNVKYIYNPEECKEAFLNALGLYRFINKIKKEK